MFGARREIDSCVTYISNSMADAPLPDRRRIDTEKLSLVTSLGKGSYGIVYKMENVETKEVFAVKRLKLEKNDNGVDPVFIREVSSLSDLRHKNVVNLIDTHLTKDYLLLIFEFLDTDLDHYITKNYDSMTKELTRSLMHDLLSGVAYCHSYNIVHRDLKPANILIKMSGDGNVTLKVADFGLSKVMQTPKRAHTLRVVTFAFRAPELLLGCAEYDKSIDMWSVGCIFYYMVMGKNAFIAESEVEMIFEVLSRLGTPTEEEWPERKKISFLGPKLPEFKGTGWNEDVKEKFGEDGLDLLNKLLQTNPHKRITADEALKHKYFTGSDSV